MVEDCALRDRIFRITSTNCQQASHKKEIFFNCSSKISGFISLSDCLNQAPCLTLHILRIINLFHMLKIAFCAVIEKAFLIDIVE